MESQNVLSKLGYSYNQKCDTCKEDKSILINVWVGYQPPYLLGAICSECYKEIKQSEQFKRGIHTKRPDVSKT